MINNILSLNEITDILNNPIVKTNKTILSNREKVVKFLFPLHDTLKAKLEHSLSIGGGVVVIYFNTLTDASNDTNDIDVSSYYELMTVNGISAWIVFSNTDGIDPSPNGGPYYAPFILNETGTYRVYPYISPPPPPPPRFLMRSLFTNNAQVYYKPHSLSRSIGNTVRNARAVSKRT